MDRSTHAHDASTHSDVDLARRRFLFAIEQLHAHKPVGDPHARVVRGNVRALRRTQGRTHRP
jgi:hypothetical protein